MNKKLDAYLNTHERLRPVVTGGLTAARVSVMPLFCLALMAILCAAAGTTLFRGGDAGNVGAFFKNICYYALLSFAVSINLHTGRMSFDCGAIMVLSTTVGFMVGVGNDNVLLTLIVAAAVGCLLSAVSGALYILLRLPSMIVSLGTTLIFEAIAYLLVRAFAYNGDIETIYLRRALTPKLLGFSANISWMLIMALTATLFMIVVFHYTKFGYDYRALHGGQRIAVNTGVREIGNAVGCYLISGVLLGLAGVVNFSFATAVQPSINFGTVSLMFECFCPLFFGGFLARYINKQAGILIGVVSYSFIQTGLGQIRNALNWNNFVIPLINATILVLFMIYQTNESTIRARIRQWFRRDKKEASA